MIMLSGTNLTVRMGGVELFQGASFQINPGEKVGLVGPNGAGKSTIFNLIVGIETPDEGQISVDNHVRVAYFSQKVGEMRGTTALAEVMSGNQRCLELKKKMDQFEISLCDPNLDPNEMTKILDEMGDVQSEFEKLGGYDIESKAQEILTGLGFPPSSHGQPVEDFSGGQKMRIALAKVLIMLPDLILMDEPTNYLDMETILWLEGWLKDFKGAIFMTSHDREFMNAIVKKIVEISPRGIISYSGNYDFYESEREIRKRQNKAEFDRQQASLKKEEEFIARFKARASHAAQVQSRVKKLDKIDRVELDGEEEKISILLPEIPRSGNDVVILKDLSKFWQDSKGAPKEVFQGLNATVHRQDKIAVVGLNGAGKSTLLKIIADRTQPSSGELKIGPSIRVGYFGQYSFENLNMENTVFEEIGQKLPSASDGFLRGLLAGFLFKGDDVQKKIRQLSGGEKSRVILASLLAAPFNFLLLDEPTNHLDIASREVLLDALQRYTGTIMLVSHDRYFLRHLATRVLEIDRGKTYLHPGNYQSYLSSVVK
jgi:ATP-binding cassette subfamily F protein 3